MTDLQRVIPHEEIGLCNCAACGKPVIGERTIAKLLSGLTLGAKCFYTNIAGRIEGRPYCAGCLGGKAVRIYLPEDHQ